MSNEGSILLMTRPRASSEAFLTELEGLVGRHIETVISPVIEIVDHGALPDVSRYATVILSSKHSVERLGEAKLLRGKRVGVVGQRTADLAESFGAVVAAVGQDADDLVAKADSLVDPVLYCRGVHTSGDIAQRLSDFGVATDEATVYDQKALSLSEKAKVAVSSGRRIIAPVFSARSSRLLSTEIPTGAELTVVAISDAAAREWSGQGDILVATEPTAASMLQSVARAL